MFTRFTSPDGRGAWVRASSIRAITEQEDGAARPGLVPGCHHLGRRASWFVRGD